MEELKKSFLAQFYHLLDEKKEAFLAENPDTTESFHYQHPLKPKFDQLYSQYKARKNAHFNNLQTNLQQNLSVRMALVDELKNLINPQSDNYAKEKSNGRNEVSSWRLRLNGG